MRLSFGRSKRAGLGGNSDLCVGLGENERQRLDIRVLNLYSGLHVGVGIIDCFKIKSINCSLDISFNSSNLIFMGLGSFFCALTKKSASYNSFKIA